MVRSRDIKISKALNISTSTIERVRLRFVESGIDVALSYRQGRGRKQRRLDGEQEAHLLALACSEAPPGRERWTLRMLADKMVELNHVESISHETVRQTWRSDSNGTENNAGRMCDSLVSGASRK